jgi:hypothetical protein
MFEKTGKFIGLDVLYHNEASANVLCERDVEEKYDTYYIPGWGKRVVVDGQAYDFVICGKRCVLDIRSPERVSEDKFVAMWQEHLDELAKKNGRCHIAKKKPAMGSGKVETVAGNTIKFTLAERERAAEARDLIRKLGFKSPQMAKEMLNNGGILNCPLTGADIDRGIQIAGRPKGYWEGKLHDRKAGQLIVEYLPPVTKKQQVAHCDIMHIDGQKYFVALINPLNAAVTVKINNTRTPEIVRALKAMMSIVSFRGCRVHSVVHDPEKSIGAAARAFPDIYFEETDVKGHVVLAERLIEELKEIIRSVKWSLPFRLPAKLMQHLVSYATIRRNSVYTKSLGEKISPREMLFGRKLDYKKELAYGFGDFVKVYNTSVRKNTMDKRAMDAIALYPTGSASGAWVFLHLQTMNTIVRKHGKAEPMSDLVIGILNALPATEEENDEIYNVPDESIVVPDEVVAANPENEMVPGTAKDTNVVDEAHPDENAESHETSYVEAEDEADEAVTVLDDQIEVQDVLEPGVSSEIVIEDVPDIIENAVVVDEPLAKRTRSGKAYSMKLVGEWAKLALVGKRISVGKAIKIHKDKAMNSMMTELGVLNEKGTFHPVDPNSMSRSEMKKIIRSFMFLTEKYDSEGNFLKLKSRLVAMGSEQDRGHVDMDVSSPTVSSAAVYTVCAIAVVEKRNVLSLDIGGAFLNAYIPSGEVILVRLDETNSELLCQLRPDYRKYLSGRKELVVRLDKALYGCVQSARLWYDTFSAFLTGLGFVVNPRDQCVFNKTSAEGVQCTVCFHVDDVLCTSKDQSMLDEFKNVCLNKYENVSITEGKKHSYLGRLFDFSEEGKCKVSMTGSIDKLLEDEQVEGVASSPATNELFIINKNSKPLMGDQKARFYSVVQRCLYLQVQFRRDIGVAVSFLTTRVREPTEEDWFKLRRLLKYINGTRDLCLIFNGDVSGNLLMFVSIDASFGIHADGKSHSGYAAMIAGGSVEAKSKKQSIVTKHSTEAEMVALSDMSSLAIWWREFVIYQGYKIGAIEIEQDNTSCIKLAEVGRSQNPFSKHINIRYFFIKDRIENGEVKLKYVYTEQLIADILTKPLQGERFRSLRAKLMGYLQRPQG